MESEFQQLANPTLESAGWSQLEAGEQRPAVEVVEIGGLRCLAGAGQGVGGDRAPALGPPRPPLPPILR